MINKKNNMKKQTLKKMWVCKREGLPPDHNTIAYNRKDSIKKLTEGTSMGWKGWRAYGWNCFKVDITFEPCSPETP
jgi:hypothetical protein